MIQSSTLGYPSFLLPRQSTSPMTSPPGLGPGFGRPVPGSPARGALPLPHGGQHGVLHGGPHGVPSGMFLASSLLQHLQHPQLPALPGLSSRCPSPPSPASTSSVSPSPSSSPPAILGTSLGASLGTSLGLPPGGVKSFTIDAILGLSGPHHQQHYLGYPITDPSSPTDLSVTNRPQQQQHHHQQQQQQQQQHSPRRTSGADGGVSGMKKTVVVGHGGHHGGHHGGNGGGAGKCKRVRTIFTADQLERLEAEFERQQYMVGPERLYLAHALNLTEAQVKVWFQNRRIKWRKQHLELEQQRLAAIKHHPLLTPLPPQQQHHMLDDVHRDSGSDDSAMSEDKAYFTAFGSMSNNGTVLHGGPLGAPHEAPDEAESPADPAEDTDAAQSARARLVGPGGLVGEADLSPTSSSSPTLSAFSHPHPDQSP